MAKTKMKRSIARRRKSGKKTKTRIRKRKNVIRGGFPITWPIVLAALFGTAKQSGMVPNCKSDAIGPVDACKTSYGDSDYIPFIQDLDSAKRTELFKTAQNVKIDDSTGDVLTGVDWDVVEKINWYELTDIRSLETEYKNGIEKKASDNAASGNTKYDKAA